MSYETDLMVQEYLSLKKSPPHNLIGNINFYRTETKPAICSDIETKVLGKPFSKRQRKAMFSKITFFKISHLAKVSKNKKPNNLEEQVDLCFEKFLLGKMNGKFFGKEILKLNKIESTIGTDKTEEEKELNEDIIFYEDAYKNNLITEEVFIEMIALLTNRKLEL